MHKTYILMANNWWTTIKEKLKDAKTATINGLKKENSNFVFHSSDVKSTIFTIKDNKPTLVERPAALFYYEIW